MDYTVLFFKALVAINKLFRDNYVSYYPTCMGKYKEIFGRDALFCFQFIPADGEIYYMYFNTAYSPDVLHYVFTSIGIVSKDNLALGKKVYECKEHINDETDIQNFVNTLKGVL